MPTANGVVVYSYAGDDWRDCRDYVHARLGLPTWQPGNQRNHVTVKWSEPEPERSRADRAKAIWDEGQDPRGTAAEEYLAARSLHLPAELCGSVLRYHPRCPWENERASCLIAAFRSISDDAITGVHRIRLDKPERWPKTERKMLGAVAGSAIKLDAPGERLAIAEGLESALAARQLGFGTTWALGSARRLMPIDGVNELVILGERDDASRKAAHACAEVWRARGRQVCLALPSAGDDFNSYLMMGAG